jgi:hypothetical protein
MISALNGLTFRDRQASNLFMCFSLVNITINSPEHIQHVRATVCVRRWGGVAGEYPNSKTHGDKPNLDTEKVLGLKIR